MPGVGAMPIPRPGRLTPVGTRGTDGPGLPPRMVEMSAGAPPRVPPEPGTGPRLVDSGTRAASGGATVGPWADARPARAKRTQTPRAATLRSGNTMMTAALLSVGRCRPPADSGGAKKAHLLG